MNLLLFVAFVGVITHMILASLLRNRIAPGSSEFAELFSWGHVRGGRVQSLKFKFLFPWVETPNISGTSRRIFFLAQVSALVTVVAIACLILGLVLALA